MERGSIMTDLALVHTYISSFSEQNGTFSFTDVGFGHCCHCIPLSVLEIFVTGYVTVILFQTFETLLVDTVSILLLSLPFYLC